MNIQAYGKFAWELLNMSDYFLTKTTHSKTGELPDLVTMDFSPENAWSLVSELLMQLRQCNPRVTVNMYCKISRVDKLPEPPPQHC